MSQDTQRLVRAALKDVPEEAAALPLPRRLAIKDIESVWLEGMEPLLPLMNKHAKLGSESHKFIDDAYEDQTVLAFMSKVGYKTSNIASAYIRYRQNYLKAPVLTVSSGLKLMLDDTGIKDNVPVKFLSAPFKTCYLEFDPAEQRKVLAHQAAQPTRLVEGCYLQEAFLDKCPDLPKEHREHLELDPNAPVRLIEITFSESPLNHPMLGGDDIGVLFDKTDYIAIYIQDENEPIKDVIDRHLAFYALSGHHLERMDMIEMAQFSEDFRENCSRLTKALFYLHVDRKTQVVQRDASALEKRLENVGARKKSKITKQLNRVYDRILIGPEKYVPISERIDSEKMKGRMTPHYRRGYFGLRWVGTGQAKTTELTRVKETIVNENLLTERTQRDYDIR
jgi:hypothetical protein